MLTDRPPSRKALLAEFERSDELGSLELPPDNRLRVEAAAIEAVLASGETSPVRQACGSFLETAAAFYRVSAPEINVLASRPLRSYEGWSSELFGDYDPRTRRIRVWMRTAVRKEVTSYGTFLSTLCHELCHHLDYERFGFSDSHHTRGFYERTAVLYHHARGTPLKSLVWARAAGGRWRIDWVKTKSGGRPR